MTKEQFKQAEFIATELFNTTQKLGWEGACHSTASIMHILCQEVGIESELCIGEVKSNTLAFDHSWIEIEGKVYDIAIFNGLDGKRISGPILNDIDLLTKASHTLTYGGKQVFKPDMVTKMVMQTPVIQYMDEFPIAMLASEYELTEYKDIYDTSQSDLWGFVLAIGNKLDLTLNVEELRKKYKDTVRIQK